MHNENAAKNQHTYCQLAKISNKLHDVGVSENSDNSSFWAGSRNIAISENA